MRMEVYITLNLKETSSASNAAKHAKNFLTSTMASLSAPVAITL